MNPYILVVDDDSIAAQLISRTVNNLGLDIQVAGDGAEALELIKAHPPQLILMDLKMPGMDGFELLSHLRGHVPASSIPLIIVTSIDQPELLMMPGVCRVFIKSKYHPEELREAAAELLAEAKQRRAARMSI